MCQSNYFNVDIRLKKAKEELKSLFEALTAKNQRSGVIKIDVEGYEVTVLRGLADAIPNGTQAVVIFESWDKSLNIADLLASFGGRASAFKLTREAAWKSGSRVKRVLMALLKPGMRTYLEQEPKDWAGDIVLQIGP